MIPVEVELCQQFIDGLFCAWSWVEVTGIQSGSPIVRVP